MILDVNQQGFLSLLQVGLWGNNVQFVQLEGCDYEKIFNLADEQAVTGLLVENLERTLPLLRKSPPQGLLLELIGSRLFIHQRNDALDKAVVQLCKEFDATKIRYVIVKGQTLAALYPQKGIRQSGDIDFYIHPDDWEKAFHWCCKVFEIETNETHSEKHVEWESGDVLYEMHRLLNDFASKKHQRYWDDVIMEEAWQYPCNVAINGYNVPTLAPTYNAIYVFVHLFFHLISEGVGLRQFIDWGMVLDKENFNIDKRKLETHLDGIGLKKAYIGLGAILTDYLGFPKEKFPFEISVNDHNNSWKLMKNILQSGNFGHNIKFVQAHGVLHGIQQLSRRIMQILRFGHYAPVESWGMITKTISWWGKKIKRMFVGCQFCRFVCEQ